MPWTKESLQSSYNLTDEEVIKTLKVCNLSTEQDEYSDEEIQSKFKLVRSYFDSNRTDTYTGAADLFALETGGEVVEPPTPQSQSESQTKTKKPTKGRKPNSADSEASSEKLFSMFELLAIASLQCKAKITFRELPQIMDSCALADREAYTQEECDRFVEACQMLKQQNKSSEEVAAHFGGDSSAIAPSQLAQQIREAADEMESNIAAITDPVLQQRAEAQALDDAQRYMQHYVQAIKQGQAVQDFWVEVRAHAKAKLSGKPQVRLIREEMATSSTQPLLQKSTDSLENLENGTSGE